MIMNSLDMIVEKTSGIPVFDKNGNRIHTFVFVPTEVETISGDAEVAANGIIKILPASDVQAMVSDASDSGEEFPEIDRVFFNEPKRTTTVLWADGTNTVVRLGEGEIFDRYTGFCACVCKKLFGSTAQAKRVMNMCDADVLAKNAAKEKAERKADAEEKAKAAHDRRVNQIAKRMREMCEAEAIVNVELMREAKKAADALRAVNDTAEEPAVEETSPEQVPAE